VRTLRLLGALALLLVPVLPGAGAPARAQTPLPLKHTPGPTTSAIDAADLMTRLYILADDSMQGRRAGENGNLKGTAYIEREVRRLGLRPAGDDGGYFQNVPLVRRSVADRSSLDVDGKTLNIWTDFTPLPGRGVARPIDGTQVIFGGDVAHPGISAAQVAGKLVLLNSSGMAGLFRMRLGPDSPLGGAAGIGIIGTEAPPAGLIEQIRRPSVTMAAAGAPVPQMLLVSAQAAELLLGAAPASVQTGAAGKTVHGQIVYDESPAPARNVVAILQGNDPKLRGQYVAIGAHNDHLGMSRPIDHDSIRAWNTVMRPMGADSRVNAPPAPEQQARITAVFDSLRKLDPDRPDSVFNGADDDGSGSVALLEVAERFATDKARPRRSILFVWHTGEELGLLGSRWFTDHPSVARDSIVAQLNMDMVGRGKAGDVPGGGPNYLQLVGSRRLSTELGDIVEAVNKSEAQPLAFDYQFDANGESHNIYCRSDHYMYARFGIPITFFTTGLHPDYHQVTDEPEYIDYPHMAHVAQLVHDVAVRVADLDHRPVVDKPKPADPNAPCRQ